MIDMLKHNDLDGLLVLRYKQDIHENCMVLRTETCRYVSMSVFHPLAKEPVLSYRQLVSYPVLRYTGDDLQSKLLQEQYRRYGAELNCLQRFDQLSTLIQFLRKNTGVAYLHKDITRFYPDLVSIPIAEETGPFTTYLVWSPNGALAHAPKRLFSVFKNYFDRLAAPTQPPPAGPEA